ncbi:MAG: hypothetical protein IPK99_18110 [Flavobacteriales bacterium]|nr:hypothetical protein [Flavobacteriales bacterium]
MRSLLRTSPIALVVVFLSACGTLNTTQVHDSVYDLPSEPVASKAEPVAPPAEPEPAPTAKQDDYYNEAESKQYADPRSYYDMTYNDPYYYNYGRFGFGMGMSSYGSGFGMSYGNGFGSNGWNDPYWNNSWQSGYGAWGNNGWNSGWNNGFGGYGGYGGFGGGFGYGNCWSCSGWNSGWGAGPYYGYGGNCYGCYQPIVIWNGEGGSQTVVAHRPSISNGRPGSGGSNSNSGDRTVTYNPVGLQDQRAVREHQMPTTRPLPAPEARPSRPMIQRPEQQGRPDRPNRPQFETRPQGGGSMDPGTRPFDGGGRPDSPSRSGGGSRSGGDRR